MRKITFILPVFLLLISFAPLAAPASADNWVSAVSITDLTGNAPLASNQSFTAGHAYNVTVRISVPFTQTSNFQPSINVKLLPANNQPGFWSVKTAAYGGYNSSNFTPGTRAVSFKTVQGVMLLSATFLIPVNLTLVTGANITRHLTQNNFPLIAVNIGNGSSVGVFSGTVQDQVIQTYLSTYQSKATLVSTGKIDQSYSTVVNQILSESQTLYTLGFPDQGTALLNTLDPASFPAPPSNSLQTYLLAGLGAAVVVIVLLAVLMVRGRGKQGFAVGIVNEVQKELAILEVTAAKYDKALADRLKTIRDKLGETS